MAIRSRSATPVRLPGESDFDASALSTLQSLRAAVSAVFSEVAGLDRAVDVATQLGLDRSLAWKLWQVGQGGGSVPSPAHIPGRQGFATFLAAAARGGAGPASIEAAQAAFEGFNRFTRTHAGDRATAHSMLGGLTDQGRERMEMALRRDGFRASAHFLGLAVEAVYQADVLLRPEPGRLPDVVRLRGHFGLSWIRRNVSWVVSRSTRVTPEGPTDQVRREPLEPGDGSALVPAFCSDPTPTLRRRVVAGVTVEDELVRGRVGATGAVDVVTAERIGHMPRAGGSGAGAGTTDAVTMALMTPCERACYDVIAPRGLIPRCPSLRVHSTVQTELPYLRGEDFNTIPVLERFEQVGELGPGRAPGATEVPRHAEMLAWLAERLGEGADGPTDWTIWRVRMRHPPVPSCLAATYQLASGH